MDADRVERLQFDHVVVELEARAALEDHVHLLLDVVVVPERDTEVRRHAHVADKAGREQPQPLALFLRCNDWLARNNHADIQIQRERSDQPECQIVSAAPLLSAISSARAASGIAAAWPSAKRPAIP